MAGWTRTAALGRVAKCSTNALAHPGSARAGSRGRAPRVCTNSRACGALCPPGRQSYRVRNGSWCDVAAPGAALGVAPFPWGVWAQKPLPIATGWLLTGGSVQYSASEAVAGPRRPSLPPISAHISVPVSPQRYSYRGGRRCRGEQPPGWMGESPDDTAGERANGDSGVLLTVRRPGRKGFETG